MFKVEMLPAADGDCFWIEYGDEKNPNRILIDSGRGETGNLLKSKINELPEEQRHFELLIISHYDEDHILGIIKFFKSQHPVVTFDDVWFNGKHHLRNHEQNNLYKNRMAILSYSQGDELSETIVNNNLPWNKAFNRKAVCFDPAGSLPIKTLKGGMKLTILSPTPEKLKQLDGVWDSIVTAAFIPPVTEELKLMAAFSKPIEDLTPEVVMKLAAEDNSKDIDDSKSNGSSIAVLAVYDKKGALFAADAHKDVLEKALKKLAAVDKKLKLDLFKIPHHGSTKNISNTLLKLIECSNFFISTNGGTPEQHNPDKEAIAKIIMNSKKPANLFFNYKTIYNDMWDDQNLKNELDYQTHYGTDNTIEIDPIR